MKLSWKKSEPILKQAPKVKKLAKTSISRHLFPVHLARIRLRDFRNYARLDADFAPGFHVLLGGNAQGKTNVLEAIYLMATLRSFRGVGGAQMIRHGQKGYFAGAKVVGQGEHEIKMYWSARERNLSLDGRPVRKLTDYLGSVQGEFAREELTLPIHMRMRLRDLWGDLLQARSNAQVRKLKDLVKQED